MTLDAYNAASPTDAVALMLSWCTSHRFAQAMAKGWPYQSPAAAEAAIDAAFQSLTWDDVLEALSGHPRIGDRVTGQSAAEQSGVTDASRDALAAGNTEYQQRFGHIFLICATGLDGSQLLSALDQRLKNDEDSERAVVTAELRKITVLRARKDLAG